MNMKELIVKLLNEGKKVKEIQQELGISEWEWSKQGYSKIPKPSKYNNIFSDINEISAYWLGFLWADGSLSNNVLELEIKSTDEEHLLKLVNSLTKLSTPSVYRRTRHNASTSRISITDKCIANSLRELGFNKKSIRIIPNIPENMIVHFIRGYFDGDGSYQYRVHNGSEDYRADISGPKEFIEYIEQYLPEISNSEIINNKTWTSKRIYWYGKKNVSSLLNYLSKNSTIKLERKYPPMLQ